MDTNTEPVAGDRVDDVVAGIIVEQFGRGITLADCKPEARLTADLHADDLDRIELLLTLEDEYGFQGEDGDDNWGTVADVISYVTRKVSGRAAQRDGAPA